MKENPTWDWKCDICHYHTSVYNTFSLTCNVIYTQVMKHEYEDNTFLFVIILPMLRAVKELTWNGLVAQEWANKKWKENLRGILQWNCSFEAQNNNTMITLNLMSRIYGSNKPWRTEQNPASLFRVWLRILNQWSTGLRNFVCFQDSEWSIGRAPQTKATKKWHTEMVPNTIISS
jgi:hypothetical protein